MSEKLLIPVLNKKIITFKGPMLYLDNDIYLDNISDEDFGAVHRDVSDAYKSLFDIKSKCFYVKDFNFDDPKEHAKLLSNQIQFVCNTFSKDWPILFPFALRISKIRKVKVQEIVEFDTPADFKNLKIKTFRFRKNATRTAISEYYKIIKDVCKKYPRILIILERFNSFNARTNIYDKIIDLTISLESLIHSSTEVSFKFSLYNSLIASSDPSTRLEIFDLFKALYDARSRIVHGDSKVTRQSPSIRYISQNWDAILKYSSAAINYYLIYLYEKDEKSWDDHLNRLTYNIDKRITD